jgi:hypothetical protein
VSYNEIATSICTALYTHTRSTRSCASYQSDSTVVQVTNKAAGNDSTSIAHSRSAAAASLHYSVLSVMLYHAVLTTLHYILTIVFACAKQAAMDQYNEEQGSAEAASSAAAAAAAGDNSDEEEQEEVEVKEVKKEKKHKKSSKKDKAAPAPAPESEEEASHCQRLL